MKTPICPHCGYTIKRVVRLQVVADTLYSLRKGVPSRPYFWCWGFPKPRQIVSILCRNCNKPFPKSHWKEIRDYLKQDALLQKLKGL